VAIVRGISCVFKPEFPFAAVACVEDAKGQRTYRAGCGQSSVHRENRGRSASETVLSTQLYEIDFEPKALVSAPPEEPGWSNLDITPSVEYPVSNTLDLIISIIVSNCVAKQPP
jgi:hypothetical protein